jgi:hypothetical protein
VETRLFVNSVDERVLCSLLRKEGGGKVELQTIGDLVFKFDLATEDVRSGPGLGDGETMLAIGVFSLDVASDGGWLGVLRTRDFKSHVGRSLGFDLEGSSVEGVVLAKEIIGRLAEILWN